MKKIILLASALMMVGCNYIPTEPTIDGIYGTVTIDSCEYIKQRTYDNYLYIHKGNCRFCKERRQKELKELVEQLKEK